MESIIQRELKRLLDKFGADYDCVTVTEEGGRYIANIETAYPPRIIGRHGSVIDALQMVFKNVFFARQQENVFLTLDVSGYRAEQEKRVTDKVQRTIETMKEQNLGEIKLFPMNPHFRRVVHLWVAQNYPELTTESIGNNLERAVRVFYK